MSILLHVRDVSIQNVLTCITNSSWGHHNICSQLQIIRSLLLTDVRILSRTLIFVRKKFIRNEINKFLNVKRTVYNGKFDDGSDLSQLVVFASNKIKRICRNPGSNRGPLDLQSNALPTELFRHM